MKPKLSDSLSPVYNQFMPQRLLKMSLEEKWATCHDCVRSKDQRFKYLYKPDLKCCTFQPLVPNFAVGALLTEGSQETQNLILEFIENKKFATPLGLIPPFEYQYLFLNRSETAFGTQENLLCPYYNKENQNCHIWQYRGVVCSTFFCKSQYGQNGQEFWSDLRDYLSYTEMALAEDCLVLLDFSPRDISDLLMLYNKQEFTAQEKKQKTLDFTSYKKLWNGYTSEKEFYKKCYDLVRKMDRSYFKSILGDQGLNLEKKVLSWNLCLNTNKLQKTSLQKK